MSESPTAHVYQPTTTDGHCADCGHHLSASWHYVKGAEFAALTIERDTLRRAIEQDAPVRAALTDEVERLRQQPCGCACHSVAGHTDEPTVSMMLGEAVKEREALRQRLEDVYVKDAGKTNEINILVAEVRKGETALAALRQRHAETEELLNAMKGEMHRRVLRDQRHAEAVHQTWLEAFEAGEDHARIPNGALNRDAAWLSSEARKAVEP